MKKEEVIHLLKSPDFSQRLDSWKRVPFHKTLNHLISALCSEDEEVKWHAVTATGFLVSTLAAVDLEGARNIVRRMIWSLNEESGGVGWGIPEALGEILARNETLAHEFAPLLVSYIQPGDNFFNFEPLRRGVLWAVGRAAQTRPELLRSLGAGDALLPFLKSGDAGVRGVAAWGLGQLRDEQGLSGLARLLPDRETVQIYLEGRLRFFPINQLAEEAMEKISKGPVSPTDRGMGEEEPGLD